MRIPVMIQMQNGENGATALCMMLGYFGRFVPMEEIREVYRNYYRTGLVRFIDSPAEGGFLSAGAYAGRDDLEITVAGNEDRILLISRFDNLGKGASGAAIQNMNLALGMEETGGLVMGNGV